MWSGIKRSGILPVTGRRTPGTTAVLLKLTPRLVLLEGENPDGVCATTEVAAIARLKNVAERIVMNWLLFLTGDCVIENSTSLFS